LFCDLLLPFHIVESEAWKRFLKIVLPQYRCISSSHLKEAILSDVYGEMKQKLISKLQVANSINLTTDGWTSANHDQYITLTVQWLTEKFEENDYGSSNSKN
jgi:hypothetical protein